MARKMSHTAAFTDIDGTPFLAIVRSLTDDAGVITRAKGGVWVNLTGDPLAVALAITDAAQAAHAFIALAEKALVKLANAPAKAPAPAKAAKAPTPPAAPAPAPAKVSLTDARAKLAAQIAELDAQEVQAADLAAELAEKRAKAVKTAKTTVAAIKPAPAKTPALGLVSAAAEFDWNSLAG